MHLINASTTLLYLEQRRIKHKEIIMSRSKNKEKKKDLERKIREEELLKEKRVETWETYKNSKNPRDRKLAVLGKAGEFISSEINLQYFALTFNVDS